MKKIIIISVVCIITLITARTSFAKESEAINSVEKTTIVTIATVPTVNKSVALIPAAFSTGGGCYRSPTTNRSIAETYGAMSNVAE